MKDEKLKICCSGEGVGKEVECILDYSKNAVREMNKVYKQHEEMNTVIVEPNSWLGKEILW